MIREISKDAESVRSGLSHVPSQPAFPPFRDPDGKLSCSVGMPSRNDKPPDIWDTHATSGGVAEQKSRFTHPQWKRVRDKHKIKIRDASLDSQPEIH